MLDKIKNYFDLYSDRKSDFKFAASDIVRVHACHTKISPTAKIEIEDFRVETGTGKKHDKKKPEPHRYTPPRAAPFDDAKEHTKKETGAELTDNENEPKWETGKVAAQIDLEYFGRETLGKHVTKRVTKFSGLWQWFALFAGVTIQPFFQNYQASHQWVWAGISGWTFFALITSFVIFPAVYKNAFDPDKPVMVQLAPIFTAGLGWHSLLATALKAVK